MKLSERKRLHEERKKRRPYSKDPEVAKVQRREKERARTRLYAREKGNEKRRIRKIEALRRSVE